MVQILNKMVHLKYPILEIWCCHKHTYTNQMLPSELKFDTKLRKVFPNNWSGSIALRKSFLQAKYCTQCCLFVLANQMQASKTQILATFGTCYSSQCLLQGSNVAKSWGICPQVGSGKIRRVLCVNFECILANQMHAFKTKILGTLWP